MSSATVASLLDRWWRGVATCRRLLRGRSVARSIRNDLARRTSDASWESATARGHEQYRSRFPPADGGVAALCVSNRPAFLPDAIENFARQDRSDLEIVLVTNSLLYDEAEVVARLTERGLADRCRVLRLPDATLGDCLNAGMDATDARFVAKFDDDDWYGSQYVSDALRAHRYADAGIVGKHTYYADLVPIGHRLLRFPGHELTYTGTLAGGTLVLDRDRIGSIRFESVSIGEDRALLAACHRAGWSTFSADRFNYVQRRGEWNTWSVPVDRFRVDAVVVDPEAPEHVVER